MPLSVCCGTPLEGATLPLTICGLIGGTCLLYGPSSDGITINCRFSASTCSAVFIRFFPSGAFIGLITSTIVHIHPRLKRYVNIENFRLFFNNPIERFLYHFRLGGFYLGIVNASGHIRRQ